uniref:Uncharacterized protein n=1 Tax=Sphaerodactylus townsendi TaxID=933632 RepID=A0ACB8FJR6_9SAUR
MAGKDGTTSGSLAGEPDEGKGLVPGKDEEPCNPDSGDEEKDALIPDRHDPSSGAAPSTSNGDSVGSPYAAGLAGRAGGPRQLSGVEAHMEKYGGDYEDEIEQVHEVGALLEGVAANWYVGLYRSRAPELRSFPHFMLALQRQFEDPFEEEKARVRSSRQIDAGSPDP